MITLMDNVMFLKNYNMCLSIIFRFDKDIQNDSTVPTFCD